MMRQTGLAVICLMLVSSAARANAIEPSIAMFWPPAAGFLLLGIVPLEAFVARWVTRYDWWTCVKASTLANLASTLAGLPIAAIVMLIPGIWLAMYSEQHQVGFWTQVLYIIGYAVPCFIVSVLVETVVARRFFDEPDEGLVGVWAVYANALTYVMIVIGLIAWTAFHG